MSDREFGGNDDLSLPKATVDKIIKEILTSPAIAGASGAEALTSSKDFRDKLIECCVEFITMITAQANEISEKDAKKTISPEHITKALTELGFSHYIAQVLEATNEQKEINKTREKKGSKFDDAGMTTEQLMELQRQQFSEAASRFQQGPADSND